MAINRADCLGAAERLGCDVAAVQAVAAVESGGRVDLHAYLYEPHVFSRLTKRAFDRDHPTISYPKWDRSKYPKTAALRRQQFDAAVALDREAAYRATSWGLFQIMGYHFATCGFISADAMATALQDTVANNVLAFTLLVADMGLADDLRACNWAAFAKGYNGAGYAQNAYDTKMAAAYARARAEAEGGNV